MSDIDLCADLERRHKKLKTQHRSLLKDYWELEDLLERYRREREVENRKEREGSELRKKILEGD
jgi:hypothetical protein